MSIKENGGKKKKKPHTETQKPAELFVLELH